MTRAVTFDCRLVSFGKQKNTRPLSLTVHFKLNQTWEKKRKNKLKGRMCGKNIGPEGLWCYGG